MVYVAMCIVLVVMSKSRTGWGLAILALALSGTIWILQRLAVKDALFSRYQHCPSSGAFHTLPFAPLH